MKPGEVQFSILGAVAAVCLWATAAGSVLGVSATTTVQDITGTPGADGVGDSFFPTMGNGGYDVSHYHIDLDIEPSANTIAAVTTITATATQDLSAFNLDFSGLTIGSLTVDGNTAAYSRTGNELTVTPTTALADQSEFTVKVSYSGTPEGIAVEGVPIPKVGWRHYTSSSIPQGIIYVVSEPSGAMTWFPCNNHPTDKATFEFELTVPDTVVATATGVRESTVTADGKTTSVWKMEDPMATYLAAVYVGDFERQEVVRAGGPTIRNYTYSGQTVSGLDAVSTALDQFEVILGDYPFDAYGMIVMPFNLGYALENQTLAIHGADTVRGFIIAHELAHQWFGNSTTVADWSEIWLHEGFAQYLHILYQAETSSLHVDTHMLGLREQVVSADVPAPMGIAVGQIFNRYAVYYRGALTLQALRKEVGDSVFYRIVKATHDRTAGGNITTEGFLEIVGELADQEAVTLVTSWLNDAAVPEFNGAPGFADTETGQRSVVEGAPPGQDIGAPLAATDPEGNDLTYTLSGGGASLFSIDGETGQLTTRNVLDYETDPTHTFTVAVSDGRDYNNNSDDALDDTLVVTVNVTNRDEEGAIELQTADPRQGAPVRARLVDPDGGVQAVTWKWETSPNPDGPWEEVTGARSGSYTPTANDVGNYLRVGVSYRDHLGPHKQVDPVRTRACSRFVGCRG